MLFQVSIVISLIVILATYEIWRRSRGLYGLKKASFTWPKPIEYLFMLYYKQNSTNALISKHKKKYGDMFVMPLMGKDFVVLAGEDPINWAAKEENNDCFIRFFSENVMRVLLGNTIPPSSFNKEMWKNTRALLSPALMQSTSINHFSPILVDFIDKRLSNIDAVDGSVLSSLAFEVGWLFIVGKRGTEYIKQAQQCFNEIRASLNSLPLNLPGTQLRKGIRAHSKMTDIINKIVESDPTIQDDKDCALSAILSLGTSNKSFSTVRVLVLLFAATDTTSITLNGLIWHLIEKPDLLKKVQDEVREKPEPRELRDFQEFTYLNKVVHEALRMFGSDFVFRKSKIPLTYNDKVQFPANTLFLLQTGYDHYSVPNPQMFDPDREQKFKLEPFGTSPRNCLGKVFVQYNIKTTIYRIFKNYNVVGEIDQGACEKPSFVVGMKNARLKLEKRPL